MLIPSPAIHFLVRSEDNKIQEVNRDDTDRFLILQSGFFNSRNRTKAAGWLNQLSLPPLFPLECRSSGSDFICRTDLSCATHLQFHHNQ